MPFCNQQVPASTITRWGEIPGSGTERIRDVAARPPESRVVHPARVSPLPALGTDETWRTRPSFSTWTAPWSTRTSTTPSAGREPSTAPEWSSRSGASIERSAWAATSSSPRSRARKSNSATGTGCARAGSTSTTRSSREVRPLPGARDLLAALRERGVAVALASSSIPKHADVAFDLLDAGEYADTATTAEDAEESKPDPELVQVALDRVGADAACVVGDSVWDMEAARRVGVPAYGVLTGGTSRAELAEAGAEAVYRDPVELLAELDRWLPQ